MTFQVSPMKPGAFGWAGSAVGVATTSIWAVSTIVLMLLLLR